MKNYKKVSRKYKKKYKKLKHKYENCKTENNIFESTAQKEITDSQIFIISYDKEYKDNENDKKAKDDKWHKIYEKVLSVIKYFGNLFVISLLTYFITENKIATGMPYILILCCVILIIEIGGSALINKGENNYIKYYTATIIDFSQSFFTAIVVSIILYVNGSKNTKTYAGENIPITVSLGYIIILLVCLFAVTYILLKIIDYLEKSK